MSNAIITQLSFQWIIHTLRSKGTLNCLLICAGIFNARIRACPSKSSTAWARVGYISLWRWIVLGRYATDVEIVHIYAIFLNSSTRWTPNIILIFVYWLNLRFNYLWLSDSGTSGWYAVKPQVLFTLKTARAIAIMQVNLLKNNIIFFISVTSVWYFLEHSSSENTWTPSYLRISSLVSEKTEWLRKSLKPILKDNIPLYCGYLEAHWKWQAENLLTKEWMRLSCTLTVSFRSKAYSLLLSERKR